MQSIKNLYEHCIKDGKNFTFSSKDEPLPIHVEGDITFENREEEGLIGVTLKACHTNRNTNGFYISKEVMEKAVPTLTNKPILGYIHEVDGQPEFYTHNTHIEGEELVYDEVPVGVIPENNNVHFEKADDGSDREYVIVNGYIYKEYSKASEIIEREADLPVSVEMYVKEMSYDAMNKWLEVTDFYFNGVTILGEDDKGKPIKPGMAGSNMKLLEFAEVDKFFEKLNTFFEKADEFSEFLNKKSTGKEDNMKDTENKAKLSFAVSGKNVEFELSLDDVTRSLCQLVNTAYGTEDKFYYVIAYPEYVIMQDSETGTYSKQNYTITEDEKIELVDSPVQVYPTFLTKEEEDALEQIKQDNATLTEEKTDLEQKNADLEAEKANLEAEKTDLEQKVTKYEKAEETAQKEAVFAKEEYADYLDTDEFKEVKANMDNYTVEELSDKCDLAFAKCVKKVGFAKKDSTRIQFAAAKSRQSKGTGRYGSTFAKDNN